MSQNDFTIANQTFPNTRADINSALQALASTSSGSSAPSTTFANQFFYNTTSNLLQIRNEGNDAYITIAELDQTNDTVEYFKSDSVRTALIEFTDGDDALAIADGGAVTVSTSLDMNGKELILDVDADTSIIASTDDRIDFKLNGGNRFSMSATGTLSFGDSAGKGELSADSSGNVNITSVGGGGTAVQFSANGQKQAEAFTIGGTTANFLRFVGGQSGSPNLIESQGTNTNVGITISSKGAENVIFKTNSAERARIDSSGTILLGQTTNPATATLVVKVASGSANGVNAQITSNSGTSFPWSNYNASGAYVGGISCTSSSTAFPTSSDYRLKENVSYSFDATTRMKQLKPCRFNFKIDTDNTVDGFLAHEVSSIVPEAVIGEKDATKTITKIVKTADGTIIEEGIEEADWTARKKSSSVIKTADGYDLVNGVSQSDWTAGKSDNTYPNDSTWTAIDALYPSDSTWEANTTKPDYQGIDQSKLVPLLVKTIQELEARITALES